MNILERCEIRDKVLSDILLNGHAQTISTINYLSKYRGVYLAAFIKNLSDEGYIAYVKTVQGLSSTNMKVTMLGMDSLSTNTYSYVLEKQIVNKRKHELYDSNVSRIHRYERRQELYAWGNKLSNEGTKFICPSCLAVNVPCNCSADTIKLPPTARVPRKNASKHQWNKFIKKFNIRKV